MSIDALFRRLAARGYFEIVATDMWTPERDTIEVDAEGRRWTIHTTQPAVGIRWAPRGQGGPRGPFRFNPFCSRFFEARTLEEALVMAVEATAPSWDSLDSIVAHRLAYVEDVGRALVGAMAA